LKTPGVGAAGGQLSGPVVRMVAVVEDVASRLGRRAGGERGRKA
jgi:hypothetical protein